MGCAHSVCVRWGNRQTWKSRQRHTRLRKISHAEDPSVLASAIGCFSPGEDSPDEALFGVQVESMQSSRTEAFPTNWVMMRRNPDKPREGRRFLQEGRAAWPWASKGSLGFLRLCVPCSSPHVQRWGQWWERKWDQWNRTGYSFSELNVYNTKRVK